MALLYKNPVSISVRVVPGDQFTDFWAELNTSYSLIAQGYSIDAAVLNLHTLIQNEINRLTIGDINTMPLHDKHKLLYLKEVFIF